MLEKKGKDAMIDKDLICIKCPMGCRLKVTGPENPGSVDELEVIGGTCPKANEYAFDEITNPLRMVCTTVKIKGGIHPVMPVKTSVAIPDKYKFDVIKAVKDITLTAPVKMGDVIIADAFGTGVDIVAERNM